MSYTTCNNNVMLLASYTLMNSSRHQAYNLPGDLSGALWDKILNPLDVFEKCSEMFIIRQ